MAIVYEKLLNLKIPPVEQTYGPKDVMLYALGLGVGSDPLDVHELAFVYEKNLKVLPTYPVVLGSAGSWLRELDTGVDFLKVVHGEQSLELFSALPPSGTVVGETRVTEIIDKGVGRGAIIVSERTITDKSTATLLAKVSQSTFARGDGGFGGPATASAPAHKVPDRKPDIVCDLPTLPQAALLYRLNADYNPLHADPDIARKAGFEGPILHGLASYGVAGFALLKSVCGYDTARLRSLSCRFTQPVFPGETLSTSIWVDGTIASFETRVKARDVLAMSNGRAQINA